jgi:cytoskeletal protein RodZ
MEVIMKQGSRLFIMMIILVGMLLLTGCDKINFSTFQASKEETNEETTTTDEDSESSKDEKDITNVNGSKDETNKSSEDTEEDSGEASNQTPTPSSIQPSENIDLPVYTVNATSGDVEPVTAAIPKSDKLSPELIVDTVVESLADQSIIVGVKTVTTKDDTVIVNFTKDNPPSKNQGSGYEGAILNAFAQSLLDNLDDYHKIIFHIDDKAYISGVYEYGIDEVYLQE